MKKAHKKTAFTIVELMMTVAIGAILILTVAAVLIITYRSWNTNNAYVRLRRDAAFAINIMARDIHEAGSSGLITGQDLLVVSNARHIARFTRNTTNGVISYRQNGVFNGSLARNVDTFITSPHTDASASVDGVNLQLEMVDTDIDLIITNKTFVQFRN